jgi:hypothetical protein
MTFDELLVEDRVAEVERRQATRRWELGAAPAGDGLGIRRALAGALVRLGAWLDRGAVEHALVTRRAH